VISVLRSHLEDVGDMDRECHSAVFSSNGVFGSKNFAMPVGDESMLRGDEDAVSRTRKSTSTRTALEGVSNVQNATVYSTTHKGREVVVLVANGG